MSTELPPQKIADILNEWYNCVEKIEKYEKKIKEYKKLISKEMDSSDKDSLTSEKYKVTRNRVTRATISRKNIPEDLWYKYSKKSTFTTYRLTLKGKKVVKLL